MKIHLKLQDFSILCDVKGTFKKQKMEENSQINTAKMNIKKQNEPKFKKN